MRALMKDAPRGGATLSTNVPTPKLQADEVLIQVKATSVCGTDLHIYRWDDWAATRIHPPLVFGHECAGEVVEVGTDVKHIKKGAHVSVETHIVCQTCYQCRTGVEHLCSQVKIVGVDRPGAFADYLAIPARNAWVNDAGLPWEVATTLEPFGNAVHSVNAGEGVSGKIVLVSGCGPIGIMAIAVAKAQGAREVYATDVNPYRLELARRMNPTEVFNASQTDVKAALLERTKGEGVDVLLEMSGSSKGIEDGFRVLKNGGSASLLGLPSTAPKVDLANDVILKGVKVHGIFGREMFRTWYQSRDLIESGKVDLSKVVTHEFTLDRYAEAMQVLEAGNCGKLVFRF